MSLLDYIPESVKRKMIFVLIALGALGWFLAAWYGRCTHADTRSDLWAHVYHRSRLQVHREQASVTGIIVDASHGRNKDGCRHEADGDGHCFLKLDAGQESFLNAKNLANEGGNLVFEPLCRYRVTQKDAIEACRNWKQDLLLPPVGSHVRLMGAWVLDTQHGHFEIHPVVSITVIP